MTSADRARIAEDIIREIDKRQLVECGCLATSAQIADIHKRAQQGEFDNRSLANEQNERITNDATRQYRLR